MGQWFLGHCRLRIAEGKRSQRVELVAVYLVHSKLDTMAYLHPDTVMEVLRARPVYVAVEEDFDYEGTTTRILGVEFVATEARRKAALSDDDDDVYTNCQPIAG